MNLSAEFDGTRILQRGFLAILSTESSVRSKGTEH